MLKMSTKSSARIKQKRRSGEPWVSNNRVLNSSAASKLGGHFGRNPNFDTDETKLLIQLWGDPKIQRTLITTHKKHAVICQLATRMQEYGYYRSPEEITTRIKNLKCFYNRLKKDMESGQLTSSSSSAAAEPSWKHFSEMDAIMTRPIFSVRPNEVPAPSLKYQLEKAREERDERRKKVLEEGGKLSDSDDDGIDDLVALSKANKQDIDDGIIPDVEVDIDISDEAFVAITNAAEKSATAAKSKKRKASKNSESSLAEASDFEGEPDEMDGINVEEKEDAAKEQQADKDLQIKEEFESNDDDAKCKTREDKQNNKVEANKKNSASSQSKKKTMSSANEKTSAALIIPKEEPIDVDAEDDDSCDKEPTAGAANVKALMPTLADILQMSKNPDFMSVSGINTITTTSVPTAGNGGGGGGGAHGKISLVPTNFLMQPKPAASTPTTPTATAVLPMQHQQQQPQQIHLLQRAQNVVVDGSGNAQMQQRILLSGSGVGGAVQATATNAGIMTTGPGGMKVLLVNAEQAGASGQMSAAVAQQLNALNTKRFCAAANTFASSFRNVDGGVLGQAVGVGAGPTTVTVAETPMQAAQKQAQQSLQQQQEQQKEQQQQQKKKQQEREKSKREEFMSKKDATGMRILLRQLLNAQTENNEIQHQRLTLERERLDFEKSIAERFLTALPTFFAQQQQQQPPQQQQPQHVQLQQLHQQQLSMPMQLPMMSVQSHPQLRLNPPKLVFTTATMPQSLATHAQQQAAATILGTAVPPTTLTTSLPKVVKPVEICTQINDIQLLTPKLENDD